MRSVQASNASPTAVVDVCASSGVKFKTVVLPDTGATDSIFPSRLLQDHGVDIDTSSRAMIEAANGTRLICDGVVRLKVTWLHHCAFITAFVSPDTRVALLSWSAMISLGMIPRSFPYSENDATKYGIVNITEVRGVGCNVQEREPSSEDIDAMRDSLLIEFKDVFDSTTEFKAMKGPPMEIHLKDMKDVKPFACTTARSIPYAFRDKAKAELDYMDSMGVTEDADDEPSDWVSPFLVVGKADGGVRLVVDYKKLNEHVRRPIHPFPSAKDIMSSVPSGSKYFTVMDATKGYWQIPLSEEAKKLTTFMTPWGRKRFC